MTPDPPLVLVEWVDSQTVAGWNDLDDLKERAGDAGRLRCRTAGFLIAGDREQVTVAASVQRSQACDAITIPRRAILSVRRLKAEKGK